MESYIIFVLDYNGDTLYYGDMNGVFTSGLNGEGKTLLVLTESLYGMDYYSVRVINHVFKSFIDSRCLFVLISMQNVIFIELHTKLYLFH